MLEEAGLIENKEGRYELTPKGIRKIGAERARPTCSRSSPRTRWASTSSSARGVGHERAYETKPYEFGDPFNLHIERTVRNADPAARAAARRCGSRPTTSRSSAPSTSSRSSTVLMLDLSLSMPMRDNFLAAKKVAMALHSLISTQFPRDYLGIVGFSEVARELKPEQLPEVSWDFVYGTNMQHGFLLSRRMLARQTRHEADHHDHRRRADRPHHRADGEVFFNYPPVRETVDATLREVARCTREGIRINTFMLDATGYLQGVRREAHAAEPRPGLLHHARDARRLRARRLHRAEAGHAGRKKPISLTNRREIPRKAGSPLARV